MDFTPKFFRAFSVDVSLPRCLRSRYSRAAFVARPRGLGFGTNVGAAALHGPAAQRMITNAVSSYLGFRLVLGVPTAPVVALSGCASVLPAPK